MKPVLSETSLVPDLDHILEQTRDHWEELRGSRLFVTGGTGFFGHWILDSFAWANARLKLRARAVVLTRDPHAFRHGTPRLAANPAIRLHCGDVRTFAFPSGTFSHLVHAATPSAQLSATAPAEVLDTIVGGTRHVLDWAVEARVKKLLLTSSGAVYGRQPPSVVHITEEYAGGPTVTDPGSAYGEGKRVAELLCAMYAAEHGLKVMIARGFAFVGPYLPLDAHFAIGNFIRDGLAGGPIRVQGDGTPVRSYLYAADLAVWLWTILFCGQAGRPYNVGSEKGLTIAETARLVADCFSPRMPVKIARPAHPDATPARYLPSTARARNELDLRATVGLKAAVQRTIRAYV